MGYVMLAQVRGREALEEPAAPAAPVRENTMSFGGLQKGFKQFNEGNTDNTMRNGLLVMVAVVVLIAVAIHVRARLKLRTTPDSERKLFRELARVVHVGFATRLLLKWVARSAKVDAAVLLISEAAFSTSVGKWAEQATFAPLRRWGKRKLARLKPRLFD